MINPPKAEGARRLPHAVVIDDDDRFRAGLGAALRREGIRYVETDEPLAWARAVRGRGTVITTDSPQRWRDLRGLLASGGWVVALLTDSAFEFYLRALHEGASGVGLRHASPANLARVAVASLAGVIPLPAPVVHRMVQAPAARRFTTMTGEDLRILQALAGGATTMQLARCAGVSQRTAHRRLSHLYERLQVWGRKEAVELAAALGIDHERP